jgi:hypothetical protein
MKIGFLQVTEITKPYYRAKVNIYSPWLADMGFVQGAPVVAVPQQDGFTLSLQSSSNKKGDGKLIHVVLTSKKNPTITVGLGKNFSTTGLNAGDFLAAGYEYGTIRAKKLPDAQKYYVIGLQNYSAFLQMGGEWLDNLGFKAHAVAITSINNGCLTFKLWNDDNAKYSEIVKFARQHKGQIVQPRKSQLCTVIDIPGYLLFGAGFKSGDISGVICEYGTIKIFRPDLRKLGF